MRLETFLELEDVFDDHQLLVGEFAQVPLRVVVVVDQALQNVVFFEQFFFLAQLHVRFKRILESFHFGFDFVLECFGFFVFEFLVEENDPEETRDRQRRLLLPVVVDRNALDQVQSIALLLVHFERAHQQNEDQRDQKDAPNEDKEREHLAHERHRVVVAVADRRQRDDDKVENVQVVDEPREVLLFYAAVTAPTYSSMYAELNSATRMQNTEIISTMIEIVIVMKIGFSFKMHLSPKNMFRLNP